jgi:hypothetical protein
MLEARGQRLFLVATTSSAQISAHETQLKEMWLDRYIWATLAAVLLTHLLPLFVALSVMGFNSCLRFKRRRNGNRVDQSEAGGSSMSLPDIAGTLVHILAREHSQS